MHIVLFVHHPELSLFVMLTVLIKSLNINSLNSADLKASPGPKVECVATYALQITGRVYNSAVNI